MGVTLKWLLNFLVQCFEALPDHFHVLPVLYKQHVMIQRLEVEADEVASFVRSCTWSVRIMEMDLSEASGIA